MPSAATGLLQTPFPVLHVPTKWHWSRAVHVTAVPTQLPTWQASAVVQAFPSLHDAPSGLVGFEQRPVEESHVPALWHWSLAVQTTGFEPVQVPAWHVSVRVHALPSLHAVPSGALLSLGQLGALPVQFSATSHAPFTGRHTVDEGLNGLAGQVADEPVQLAGRSQTPAALRHCVPACPGGC